MVTDMSFVCVDCGKTYTMSEKEYARFKELSANITNFKMPRRCAECRKLRREQGNQSGQAHAPQVKMTAKASIVGVTPIPEPSPVPAAKSEEAPETKEISLVLATKDFDDLVNGRPVVWRGVKVVLADIGFATMRKAIDEAELEKAKKLVKANGH